MLLAHGRLDPRYARFDFDSAVLVPATWNGDQHPLAVGMFALVLAAKRSDTHTLVLAGHASRDGDDAHNQELSACRAASIRMLMFNERAAWVELATKHGSLRDIAFLVSVDHKPGA